MLIKTTILATLATLSLALPAKALPTMSELAEPCVVLHRLAETELEQSGKTQVELLELNEDLDKMALDIVGVIEHKIPVDYILADSDVPAGEVGMHQAQEVVKIKARILTKQCYEKAERDYVPPPVDEVYENIKKHDVRLDKY